MKVYIIPEEKKASQPVKKTFKTAYYGNNILKWLDHGWVQMECNVFWHLTACYILNWTYKVLELKLW